MNFSKLQQNKIEARLKLNQLPADLAQEKADVLSALLWLPDLSNLSDWDFFTINKKWMTNKLSPPQLRDIFLKLQSESLDIVLVGGQAVNFWATYYRNVLAELEQFLPFASEDIDFFGGRLEASICHQLLGGQLNINRSFDSSPNSAVLLVDYEDSKLRIDFLSNVFGLSDEEILDSAIYFEGQDEIAGISFKIINPISCVKSKLKSLVGLPQQGRQDLKHLQISLLCCRGFLKEICINEPPRIVLKLIENLFKNSISDAGLKVWLEYDICIDSAIPFNCIENLEEEKWVNFRNLRLPQIQSLINSKRLKYREIFG